MLLPLPHRHLRTRSRELSPDRIKRPGERQAARRGPLHSGYCIIEARPGTHALLGWAGCQVWFENGNICGVVAAPTAREALALVRLALRRTGTVELRLDYLESEDQFAELLRGIAPLADRATFIATCRRVEAGGRFAGSMARQISRLVLAAASGCAWCDLEIETAEKLSTSTLRKTLGDVRLIVSAHDFRRTPARLGQLRLRLEATGADLVKIGGLTRNYRELVRLLRAVHRRRNVVVAPMGEVGLPGRVLALREGSAVAYAAAGPSSAPGQLSLEEMQSVYRADRHNRRTRLYGVIGDPIGHSLSPLLHNTGFVHRHVNAVFVPFLVRDLRDFLKAVRPLGIAGFSVTLPHKQHILRHLDECDPEAAEIGAVNTVVCRGDKLHGYNTDHIGVLRALERRASLAGSRVLIFGAGGAARTAGFVLARAGSRVFMCARRPEAARRAAHAAGAEAIERKELREMDFDIIVNATPIGMYPHSDTSPLEPAELRCRLVFDLIYRPLRTRLLQLAERRGIETLSGAEMFLAQGIAQWELWTGEKAPEAAMRAEVMAALAREERSPRPSRPRNDP
jgi:3-dehydroquinate dehydratase/shikimate dehydrogenase